MSFVLKDLEGHLREDASQVRVQNQEARKQETQGRSGLLGCISGARQETSREGGLVRGCGQACQLDRSLVSSLGPSIFLMSGSGLDAGIPSGGSPVSRPLQSVVTSSQW